MEERPPASVVSGGNYLMGRKVKKEERVRTDKARALVTFDQANLNRHVKQEESGKKPAKLPFAISYQHISGLKLKGRVLRTAFAKVIMSFA